VSSADALALVETLRNQGLKLAAAESCTGGLLAARITDVPGSSDVFAGGIVSYSNEVKVSMLGVSPESLSWHGAVSEKVACEMAEGARVQLGADIAVGITGIAGPGGGSADKPVGLVWIAWSTAGRTEAQRFQFAGDRAAVRRQSVDAALAGLAERVSQTG
jgi:PncC family amidohydrolase